MLAYVLALAVGIGSLAIYLAAFFFPEIHRKNDFILSGVGLFYALVLWVFAPRITGGLLLGHVASVALLWWFGFSTLSLRRQLTPQIEQTPVPSSETVKTSIQQQITQLSLQERLTQLQQSFGRTFGGVKGKVQQVGSKKTSKTVKPEDITSVISEEPAVEIIDATTPTVEQPPEPPAEQPAATVETVSPITIPEPAATETVTTPDTESKTETVPPVIPPNPPSVELVEAAQAQTEEKPAIPVEEVAPDAVLAPPAEAPVEQKLPNNQGN